MLKLDLGCGNRCLPGYIGVDYSAACRPEVVFDLSLSPWPWPRGSVEAVNCFHMFEHLTGRQRMTFMDELWRVMAVGARALITTPHWSSMRSVQDPTHQWPPVCEMSYAYFNREWRQNSRLEHYPLQCNFRCEYKLLLSESVEFDNEQSRLMMTEHTINTVNDLEATLIKEP